MTQHLCMETLKGEPKANFFRSHRITSEFPEQVLVLKTNDEIARMSSGALSPLHFVDWEQTKHTRKFLSDLRHGAMPSDKQLALMDKRGKHATAILEDTSHHETIIRHFAVFKKRLGAETIRTLRSSSRSMTYTQSREIGRLAMELADLLHGLILGTDAPKEYEQARDRYLFRQALAYTGLFATWASLGGIDSVSRKKLKNDLIDSSYAAFASCFDGLLSNDNKQREIYETVLTLLRVTDSDYDPNF